MARGNNPSPCPLPGGEGGINHEGQEHEILGLEIGIWKGRKKSQCDGAGNEGIEPRMARITRMGKDSDIHVNRSTIMTSNRPLEE